MNPPAPAASVVAGTVAIILQLGCRVDLTHLVNVAAPQPAGGAGGMAANSVPGASCEVVVGMVHAVLLRVCLLGCC